MKDLLERKKGRGERRKKEGKKKKERRKERESFWGGGSEAEMRYRSAVFCPDLPRRKSV